MFHLVSDIIHHRHSDRYVCTYHISLPFRLTKEETTPSPSWLCAAFSEMTWAQCVSYPVCTHLANKDGDTDSRTVFAESEDASKQTWQRNPTKVHNILREGIWAIKSVPSSVCCPPLTPLPRPYSLIFSGARCPEVAAARPISRPRTAKGGEKRTASLSCQLGDMSCMFLQCRVSTCLLVLCVLLMLADTVSVCPAACIDTDHQDILSLSAIASTTVPSLSA